MDPLLGSILASVIASTLMLFIEPRVAPRKKKAEKSASQPLQSYQHNEYAYQQMKAPSVIPRWVSLVLAICLPPLSVYLEKGACKTMWVNIGLTMLWFWPGIFHALLVVMGKQVSHS